MPLKVADTDLTYRQPLDQQRLRYVAYTYLLQFNPEAPRPLLLMGSLSIKSALST